MSKVLITGDKGYIGTKLKSFLKKKEVTVFTLKKRIDKDFIKNKNLPIADIVVHLAAKTNVPKSWNYEDDYIVHNINSTKYILDYCVKNKCKMIFISSYLYGNTKKIPTSEKSALKTLNPYALSKKMCEDMCYFYEKYYGINLIIIRPFNIYGPDQNTSWLISNIINQVKNKKKIILMSLHQKRDYIYIDDFSDLIYTLIEKNLSKGTFNLGSGRSYSIKNVVDIVQKINKSKKIIVNQNIIRKNDIMETKADISKLYDVLQWKPKWSLKNGIALILKK